MRTTRRFRIGSTGVVGVLALMILALLPGAALADHGVDTGCIDTATAEPGGDEGGGSSEGGGSEEGSGSDEPVSSDGDAAGAPPGDGEGAEEFPPYLCYGEGQPTSRGGGWGGASPEFGGGGEAGAGGDTRAQAAAAVDCGGSGGPGGGAGSLAPDSDTAGIDVDTAGAELDEQWFSQWFSSSAVTAGAGSRRAAALDCVRAVALVGGLDDGLVPTRIDAGAGGAAPSANGPALAIAITTLMGAAFEVVRRRRR